MLRLAREQLTKTELVPSLLKKVGEPTESFKEMEKIAGGSKEPR